MRFLTSYLTPAKTKASLKLCVSALCLWELGFCSGNVNVMQVSHAPPATCAVPRNGVLVLQKNPINDGHVPVRRVQNAVSGSSAFPCGPGELAIGNGLET